MKTPREILSERHQSADPKLDELRKDFVAELSAPVLETKRARLGIFGWFARGGMWVGPRRPLTRPPATLSPDGGEGSAGGPLSVSLAPIGGEGRGEGARVDKPNVVHATHAAPTSFPQKLWRELIVPYRRGWTGLAAIWLVILGVNFVTSVNTPQVTLAKATPPTTEVLTALKEQNQMLAQLLGPIESTPARRVRPGPSSQRREESYAV